MTHTPTPWHVEEGHIQRDSGGIRYWQITDGQDAIACNQFCYAGYDPDVNIANARHIVRCVNTHDALVKALEGILKVRVQGWENIWAGSNRCQDIARAALALAKGEGE